MKNNILNWFSFIKRTSLWIFFVLFIFFNINFRVITSGDNIVAKVVPISIINFGKISFYNELVNEFISRNFSSYLTNNNGKFYPNTPLTGVWETLPLYIPNALIVNFFNIPISINDSRFIALASIQEKFISSLLTSLSLYFVFLVLKKLKISNKVAIFSIFFFAFTSNIWTTNSQGFWTHTIVFFNISFLLFLLVNSRNSILKDILIGLLTILTLFSRPHSFILLAPLLLWSFINNKFNKKMTFLFILFFGVLYIAFNFSLFGSFFGYYSNGSVSYDFGLKKFLNVFLSPSKGFLIYQPYLFLLFIVIFKKYNSFLRKKNNFGKIIKDIDIYIIFSVISYLIFIYLYHYWWGGHSFGPRLMVDLELYLLILFAIYFKKIVKLNWSLLIIFGLWSFILQFSGAFFYPLGFWDDRPLDVDREVNRVWSLDTQYVRSFRFGPDEPFLLKNILFLLRGDKRKFVDPLIR